MGLMENEFLKYLNKFDKYPFEVELDKKKYRLGEGDALFKLKFNKLPDIESLLESTTIAFGEAYMLGNLEIEGDLYEFFKYAVEQSDKVSIDKKSMKKLIKSCKSQSTLKKNIKKYCNLNENFRELVFGNEKNCAIGYFNSEEDTIDTANKNNVMQLMECLDLQENMSVCEISFNHASVLLQMAAAQNIEGVLVATDKAQSREFSEKVVTNNLSDRIEVKNIDYRQLVKLEKQFDRIIINDVVEYIGKDNLCEFFSILKQLLKDDGKIIIQSSNMPKESITDLWIKKYIKPGIEIPALTQLMDAVLSSGYKIIQMKDMRKHLIKTYLTWYENLCCNKDEIEEIYDSRFYNGWMLYLAGYAAAYTVGTLDYHQIVIGKIKY